LLALAFLLYPFLAKESKVQWVLLNFLWLSYAISNLLLEATLGERWVLLGAGVLLAGMCLKNLRSQKPIFKNINESPATKALIIFTLVQVLLSIVFNVTGRVSLAKIFGVSAIQCLLLGVSLKVFCTVVLEAIYLQSDAIHESRLAEFINFKTFQHRFLRLLWTVAICIWTVSLIRNLTLYDLMLNALDVFFNKARTIGSMVFTFKSVAVFICIIWLSSLLSRTINFFFGNHGAKHSRSRSRIGSMMLLIRLTIWTLGFCIAVAAAGIPIDRLSLMLGALGVGIGFGLQNIVNNLVSGVILAFERPIQIGDLIEVGGKMGTVKEIGVRSSKINNNQGADIIVPNGDLLSQQLINWTMQDRNKQIEFTIGVSYQADLKKATTLVREELIRNKRIMKTPLPSIHVQQFREKAVDLRISFWVHDLAEANVVRSQAMIDILDALNNSGIEFSALKGALTE